MSKLTKNSGLAIIAIALTALSAYFLYNAYQIWSGYNWAMWRLQYSILFIAYNTLYPKLLQAISSYVALFPVYFFLGLVTLSLALNMLAIIIRKRILFLVVSIVSGVLLLGEASRIYQVYQWANLQSTTPPFSHYGNVRAEAVFAYENLFFLYMVLGSIEIAFALIFTAMYGRRQLGAKAGRMEPSREPTLPVSS